MPGHGHGRGRGTDMNMDIDTEQQTLLSSLPATHSCTANARKVSYERD